ncbi:MAG: large conductance mechanosensitive channel protein MscL [Acidobacteriota bacterium]
MSMAREFKDFLVKQNALALAVAVIIGAAIGKVVSSIVDDVINPIFGLALPGGGWRDAKIVLAHSTDATGKVVENSIQYGHLLGAIVDFVIIGLVVFMIIKYALPKPEAAPSTKECPQCKTLIPASATRCSACTQPVG